jgi:hypothetical protein
LLLRGILSPSLARNGAKSGKPPVKKTRGDGGSAEGFDGDCLVGQSAKVWLMRELSREAPAGHGA